MKVGILLHADRGVDAVMEEARAADDQGYDSIWLSDHLMDPYGNNYAEGPLDYFVLMTALAAVTKRVRLAWGVLSLTFRPPAVFAKMISSLDQISHGRVICTIGSGWFKEEYLAYNLPLIDDHDERLEYTREVILLFKELWTRGAPERTTFEGKHVQVYDLPFNPLPYQKPYPPIWIGGESDATLAMAKELATGWITLRSANRRDTLEQVLSAPGWPDREMTVVKNCTCVIRETKDEADRAAREEYEKIKANTPRSIPDTFEGFLERDVAGTPEECLARIRDIESWGVNYLRFNFASAESQALFARLVLPKLNEVSVSA